MLSESEYDIIKEASCGPEEFFVLVSSVYPGSRSELEAFIRTLTALVQRGFLRCFRGSPRSDTHLTLEDLQRYVEARLAAGESLDAHPESVEELAFAATDLGIVQLRPEDRPVPVAVS